ncbi:MAG: DoxX family membrane protein [Sphingobacteriales bacterium]|nr:MAG: DoxX family membrane protein [Sphingobacteriales bacterium]
MAPDKEQGTLTVSIARWLVGLLFIFSGAIKMNDPLGFGYKLTEYFDVFHLSFLNGMVTPLAVLLCAAEIVLGVLLLFGLYKQKVLRGLLVLIVFFTFLTFISAAFKVVTSCGCFGDAIPLTPWQSFAKDLVLLLLILYIYKKQAFITPVFKVQRAQRTIFYISIALSLAFGIYTLNFLPVVDFLPYKVGANIPAEMLVPQGAKPDEYKIIYQLKHKTTGETKKMSDTEYLSTEIWKDTSWEIVGTPERTLVKTGFKPKIADLIITDVSGTNYTKELIENPYYTIVLVAYDLGSANEHALATLNAISINAAEQFNIRTIVLTSTAKAEATAIGKKLKLFPEIFYADNVPLKSMVRANPGILLLKNGTIINKWHHNNMPSFDELSATYFSK